MTQKLHILFLCGWYPSKVLPTNGDFIQRHAEAVATKQRVTALHIISDKNREKNHITIDEINGVQTFIGYVAATNNPILKIYRFWKIFKKIIAQIDPFDIVHLNEIYPFGIFAVYLKNKFKTSYIISEHWTGYHFPKSKKINFFQKIVSKKITKKANFICPVSNDLGKSMQKFGLLGNYSVVPNVVNTNLFKPADKTSTNFTLIHISSLLDAHKNISGMLHVAKKLESKINNFTWKFIGGSHENFINLIEDLAFKKNTIQFYKHLNHNELIKHLQQSSVFILFSNYENLPCVILESFASGIPVISTDVGGIKEFFPSNFGQLIKKANQQELENAILKFYNTKSNTSEEMHKYAVTHFSQEAIASQFFSLYVNSLTKK